MPEFPYPTLPRRPLPGGGPSVSVLGFAVDLRGPAGPTLDRGAEERLRRARAAGVNLFDAAGVPDPLRARALLASAFPEPDPDLVVVVARGPESESPVRPSPAARPRETDGLLATRNEAFASIVEVSRTGPGPEGAKASELPDGTLGPLDRFALRLDPADEHLPVSPEIDIYTGPLSLLDSRLGPYLDRAARERPIGFLARDPFAGGRLDGSRWAGGGPALGPAATPLPIRSLAEEFAPVLRLGFLTARRTRTLAQAALQYVASRPWVVGVLAPLPPVDRLDEVLSTWSVPPLTAEEIARVDELAGSTSKRPRGSRFK